MSIVSSAHFSESRPFNRAIMFRIKPHDITLLTRRLNAGGGHTSAFFFFFFRRFARRGSEKRSCSQCALLVFLRQTSIANTSIATTFQHPCCVYHRENWLYSSATNLSSRERRIKERRVLRKKGALHKSLTEKKKRT